MRIVSKKTISIHREAASPLSSKVSQGRSPVVDFDWQQQEESTWWWEVPLLQYTRYIVQFSICSIPTHTSPCAQYQFHPILISSILYMYPIQNILALYSIANIETRLTPPFGVKCMLGPPQLPFLSSTAWKRVGMRRWYLLINTYWREYKMWFSTRCSWCWCWCWWCNWGFQRKPKQSYRLLNCSVLLVQNCHLL